MARRLSVSGKPPLTRRRAKAILTRLTKSAARPECLTCDCCQAFIAQLELDSPDDISDLTSPLKCPRAKMHGCLGCCPCPPGALYAGYLRPRKE